MEAIHKLADLDRHGVYVLTKGDLAKAFPAEKEKAFEKSLQRLVSDGVLQRVARGTYGSAMAKLADYHIDKYEQLLDSASRAKI